MAHADIIVPRGGDNKVAIQLIVQHVNTQLQLRGFKVRETLAHSEMQNQPMPNSLFLLPETPQVSWRSWSSRKNNKTFPFSRQIKGLHTFIRNANTSRDEFIFYSNRLIRLVIEYAMSLMPFKDVAIDTPQGITYSGKRMSSNRICGVSILRAGETMEQAVSEVCKNIRIGKILIQTNQITGEPEVSLMKGNCLRRCWKFLVFQLYYLRLPKDIKDYRVILMDATVATGAAGIMAIRVLLDHDVPEENIMLVSLLMAEIGVHSIAYAFPKVSWSDGDLKLFFNDSSSTGSDCNVSPRSGDQWQVLRHSRDWELWWSLLWNGTRRKWSVSELFSLGNVSHCTRFKI